MVFSYVLDEFEGWRSLGWIVGSWWKASAANETRLTKGFSCFSVFSQPLVKKGKAAKPTQFFSRLNVSTFPVTEDRVLIKTFRFKNLSSSFLMGNLYFRFNLVGFPRLQDNFGLLWSATASLRRFWENFSNFCWRLIDFRRWWWWLVEADGRSHCDAAAWGVEPWQWTRLNEVEAGRLLIQRRRKLRVCCVGIQWHHDDA